MTLTIKQGDLFDQETFNFDFIAQGTNCFGIMGAGIATVFKDTFPLMYEEYVELCVKYRDILPGLIQISSSDTMASDHTAEHSLPSVINMFSQYYPGPDATYENLERSAFLLLKEVEQYHKCTVGLPWIGCGIGGLQRYNVLHILKRYFEDSHVDFIIVQQEAVEESK